MKSILDNSGLASTKCSPVLRGEPWVPSRESRKERWGNLLLAPGWAEQLALASAEEKPPDPAEHGEIQVTQHYDFIPLKDKQENQSYNTFLMRAGAATKQRAFSSCISLNSHCSYHDLQKKKAKAKPVSHFYINEKKPHLDRRAVPLS